jgi:hypothetical protein
MRRSLVSTASWSGGVHLEVVELAERLDGAPG